mgnify:FL=1
MTTLNLYLEKFTQIVQCKDSLNVLSDKIHNLTVQLMFQFPGDHFAIVQAKFQVLFKLYYFYFENLSSNHEILLEKLTKELSQDAIIIRYVYYSIMKELKALD